MISSANARRAGSSSRSARTSATGIETYTGDWTVRQMAHLLKRTMFGSTKADLSALKDMTMTQAVDLLLSSAPVPEPPVVDYNDASEGIEDPDVAFGETWVDAARNGDFEGLRITSLKSWMIRNMANQGISIHEKMNLFWHNLIPTQIWGVFLSGASYQYLSLTRAHALGNFKSLIKDVTIDPSMLLYLNGAFNSKQAPDENYGRELQELFCIGKGPNARFTEEDVQLAARVLTGWSIDWDDIDRPGIIESRFNFWAHDTSDKVFSSFYGNRVIEGKEGDAGAEELDELLEMIFDNDEVALYICRRLYNFFVYSEIDAAAEQNVIVPLAEILRANDFNIKPVLEALFKSAHFYDEINIGAMIKNPADWVIGVWRTIGVDGMDPNDSFLTYRQYLSMIWTLSGIGMEMGDPPSVSGWPAYYQTPQFDKSWINTDTITKRANYTDSLFSWGFWVYDDEIAKVDLTKFLETLDNPYDPTALIEEVSTLLFGIAPSQDSISNVRSILLSGQQEDYYWTDAWVAYQDDKENQEAKLVVRNRLVPAFTYLLQLAEAQLT